jgi:hypothetical protein
MMGVFRFKNLVAFVVAVGVDPTALNERGYSLRLRADRLYTHGCQTTWRSLHNL